MAYDPKSVKLGKLPKQLDPNARKLASYFVSDDIQVPAHVDWSTKVSDWGMMDNDTLGDCTAAGVGHIEMLWTSNASTTLVIENQDIINFYSATTGFVPGDESTDQGGIETNVLNYWKTTGFKTVTGVHQIAGWVSVNPHDTTQVKAGINWFGAIYAGVALPLGSQDQDVWDVKTHHLIGEWAPASWGGHCVPLVGYNAVGPVCVTWGALKQITWAWWLAYADEAYVAISKDWLNSQGVAPNGLNWTQLESDLELI